MIQLHSLLNYPDRTVCNTRVNYNKWSAIINIKQIMYSDRLLYQYKQHAKCSLQCDGCILSIMKKKTFHFMRNGHDMSGLLVRDNAIKHSNLHFNLKYDALKSCGLHLNTRWVQWMMHTFSVFWFICFTRLLFRESGTFSSSWENMENI